MITKQCLFCGKKFSKKYNRSPKSWQKAKFCSYQCYWGSKKGKHISFKTEFQKGQKSWNKGLKGYMAGKDSPSWKGGQFQSSGYIYITNPNHPNAVQIGYVLRSHLVAEKYLGRYLTKLEVVHHINEIKDDDRPENLYLFPSRIEHNKCHFSKNKHKLKSNLIPYPAANG